MRDELRAGDIHPDDDPEIMNSREVAAMLKKTQQWVTRAARGPRKKKNGTFSRKTAPRLPGFKLDAGGEWFFRRRRVLEWLDDIERNFGTYYPIERK